MFTEDEMKAIQAEIRQEVDKREKSATDIFDQVEGAYFAAEYANEYYTAHEEEASEAYRNLLSEVYLALEDALEVMEKLRVFDPEEDVTKLIMEKFRVRKIARLN